MSSIVASGIGGATCGAAMAFCMASMFLKQAPGFYLACISCTLSMAFLGAVIGSILRIVTIMASIFHDYVSSVVTALGCALVCFIGREVIATVITHGLVGMPPDVSAMIAKILIISIGSGSLICVLGLKLASNIETDKSL